jgi:poly-gamma-glutamate synthesis protein (capsule biosynthesis protein)
MTQRLRDEGFTVLGEGEVAAFPGFDLFAASDVRNRPGPARQVLRAGDFPVLSGSKESLPHRPRLAFLHWGAEYRKGPDQRQGWLAGAAAKAGFDLLIGCHAHVPSPATQDIEGIPTLPTLGNLLFDQSQRERGGVLLEVRFFEQGTFATRVIPVGNLYREWRGK